MRRFLRPGLYLGLAAAIVGGAVYLNARPQPPDDRVDVDPQVALNRGPHDHEQLGTACLCDPELEIKQALADRADFASTYKDLADRFRARGQYPHAERCYLRALELNPDNPDSHYGLGTVYTKLRRYQDAEAQYRQAAELRRDFADAYISLGILAYREGDFAMAQQQWTAATRVDPRNEYAERMLAMIPRGERLSDTPSSDAQSTPRGQQ